MLNFLLILLGKTLSKMSKSLKRGHGSTWPGHLALKFNPHFLEDLLSKSNTKVILIAGTNGKTTTSKMLKTILEKNGSSVIHNESGANLLNGITSSLILHKKLFKNRNTDFAIFEVDENVLPLALKSIKPDFIIILNLFRDQLDRYGEVDSISVKWRNSINVLSKDTTLILNSDDPQVAFLGNETNANVMYFGLSKREKGNTSIHAADSLYCPRCKEKLTYNYKLYSHLGDWYCQNCLLKRPKIENVSVPYYPLSGIYNEYNTVSVVLTANQLNISSLIINEGLHLVKPAFGRQEIIEIGDKKVQLFLSKNPTGFNESLRTISQLNAENLLLILNDRVADGHDVSWIWDVDFESFINNFKNLTVSGDRVFDMALRIKYTDFKLSEELIYTDLAKALKNAIEKTPTHSTLFILPTYTAMLEVRKELKGKSIL